MKKQYITPMIEEVVLEEDLCDNQYWKPQWSWQNPSGDWSQEGGWGGGGSWGQNGGWGSSAKGNPIWDDETISTE